MNFQAPYCLCKIKQSPHVRPLHPGPSEWSPRTELHHPHSVVSICYGTHSRTGKRTRPRLYRPRLTQQTHMNIYERDTQRDGRVGGDSREKTPGKESELQFFRVPWRTDFFLER